MYSFPSFVFASNLRPECFQFRICTCIVFISNKYVFRLQTVSFAHCCRVGSWVLPLDMHLYKILVSVSYSLSCDLGLYAQTKQPLSERRYSKDVFASEHTMISICFPIFPWQDGWMDARMWVWAQVQTGLRVAERGQIFLLGEAP